MKKTKSVTAVIDALNRARRLKRKWAGQLARLSDDWWTKRTTSSWPDPGGLRSRGRPYERWSDTLKILAGADYFIFHYITLYYYPLSP